MPHSQQSASEGAPSFDRIGFPTYQGNNREIRRSGRAHHRIYVEKTVYLSYFESNSLRNRTGELPGGSFVREPGMWGLLRQ